MHNRAWEAILRHIPAAQQDQFILVTASGTEIALQGFLRVEAEFFVVKGRLAGSQEQGRMFFIPYTQIDYFGTSKPIKDTEYNDLFGTLDVPAPAEANEVEAAAPAVNGPGMVAVAPSAHGSGLRPPIRSEVLERFRSNRNGPGGPPSSGNLPRPNQP